MAIRPDNHIIGDKAIRTISSKLIPEEWTISIPDSDYGLDMLIEVIINNKTTGRFFFIQSKGTSEASENGEISYSMDVSRIKDYAVMKFPVLFVYYSKEDDKFWGRWMNPLYDTLTDAQKKQKTVTLHFFSYNEIDANYLRSIGGNIDLSLTNSVSIYCEKVPSKFERFHIQMINVAKQYIGTNITNDVKLTCKTLFLSYYGTLENGKVTIQCNKENSCVLLNLASVDCLYYNSINREECPECLLELIYMIAMYSSQISYQSQDYILRYPTHKLIDYIPHDKWIEFINKLSFDKIKNIFVLFDLAIQYGHHDIAQYILLMVFIPKFSNEDCRDLSYDLLSRYLSFNIEDSIKGKLFYNLANIIKNKNVYESFSFYMKAIRCEPLYKQMYYWWKEVAGLLYVTKHYSFAEYFYKKSRELDKHNYIDNIEILISDCLICQGKIEEALAEEHRYTDKSGELSAVVCLKIIITEIMDKEHIDIFESAYWFNRGISECNDSNFEKSLIYFLISWRLNDGDIEALTNAFIQALNVMDINKLFIILKTIREISPDCGYKYVVSTFLSNMDSDRFDKVSDKIKELFYSDKYEIPIDKIFD